MPFTTLILSVSIAINSVLLLILLQSKKEEAKIFSRAIGGVIIWGLTVLFFPLIEDYKVKYYLGIVAYLSTLATSTYILLFALIFPKKTKSLFIRFRWLIYLISGLWGIILILYPKSVLIGVGKEGYKLLTSKGAYFLFSTIGAYLLATIAILVKKYFETSNKLEKFQLRYVFAGILLTSIIGFFTNAIFALTGKYEFVWVGPSATLIFVVFTTYAITKHHLFEIKVVATEILVVLLLVILFLDIFTADNLQEILLRIAVFLSVAIFGIFLIKAVLLEVKAREELEKTDKAKTEFLSMASHQLRTPLTAIKGYVSLALEGYYGELNSKLKKALKNVAISTERLIRIVQDLLTISRIEMGKLELNLKPVDLANLAKSCLKELEFEAKKKNIDLIFKNPNQPLPKINLDSLKIRQAILNLIDNAIKYTNEGGKVEVSLDQERLKENHKERDYLKVIVKDTGVGFDPEEQSKLFESFSRGSAGIAKFVEGAGLGLNVAKRFVEIHQGFITAFSEGKNKGSTFTIYLPVGS